MHGRVRAHKSYARGVIRVAPWIIAIALAGCRDKQVEQVKTIRDAVCACQDIKCGEEAMKLLPATPPGGHRAQKLATEMVACMSKLYLKKEPTPEPAPDLGEQMTQPDGGIQINWDAKER